MLPHMKNFFPKLHIILFYPCLGALVFQISGPIIKTSSSLGPLVVFFLATLMFTKATNAFMYPQGIYIFQEMLCLMKYIDIKDLGALHFFLDIEIVPDCTGLLLSQSECIRDLLLKTKMDGAKPVTTPMAASSRLSWSSSSTPFSDPYLYRSTVGALQYLAITRPYLAYSVNKVSQSMQSPTEEHWIAVKRILRYRKHTISYGLLLQPINRMLLYSFTDAD